MCPIESKTVSAELKKFVTDFELEGYEFSSTNDSLIIKLYCNTDIAFDNLPEYYKINSNYTQINSVSYMLLGVDDEKKPILRAKYDSINKLEY
jgi:hypothetical protein